MIWWLWLVLGFVLLGCEVLTPGFFLIFFGVAAIIVGAITGIGIELADWAQWFIFAALSVASLAVFRNKMRDLLQPSDGPRVDDLVGQLASVVSAISPNEIGKVELRGASWSARNSGPTVLHSGQRCRVERIDGLTLIVKSE